MSTFVIKSILQGVNIPRLKLRRVERFVIEVFCFTSIDFKSKSCMFKSPKKIFHGIDARPLLKSQWCNINSAIYPVSNFKAWSIAFRKNKISV